MAKQCKAQVRGKRCSGVAVDAGLCSRHLTAGQKRELKAQLKAETDRVRLARSKGADGVIEVLDGQVATTQELITQLITEKAREITRLRELAREDAERAGDGGYGLRVVRKEASIGTGGDQERREQRLRKDITQSVYYAKAWEAERDLLKMLSTNVNIDTQEAMVKAQVRSRREYLNDMREVVEAARSFPEASADELIYDLIRQAKRERDAA